MAYDLVLVTVRQERLASIFPELKPLRGAPTILLFGNNPAGQAAIPKNFTKRIELGFPGISGSMVGDTVEYIRIAQQPTVVQTHASSPTRQFAEALRAREFKVKEVADMDGYLLYHAVFVASISAALYHCDTDLVALSKDRATLVLMCSAIEEGFRILRRQGKGGEPGNLRVLHQPLLRPFAVRYWGRVFRSPLGEFEFAAHARHAQGEMAELARAVLLATENDAVGFIIFGNYWRIYSLA